MAENQEEKIKNLLWGKGYTIDTASEKLEISRQTFYNQIRKSPLSDKFVRLVKDKLNINLILDESSTIETIKKPDQNDLASEYDKLKQENEKLKAELLEALRELSKKK